MQEAVGDDQVAPFDQVDAHLLREERVLEVGRVVKARRQQGDARRMDPGVHQRLQRVEQAAAIVVDRPDAGPLEDLRKRLLHQLAVLQHVRHARGAAQVVFEHVEPAVAVADQVGAGDVAPDALGRIEADALPAKGRGRLDDMLRERRRPGRSSGRDRCRR